MDELTVKVFVSGAISTNCYIVFNNESKEAFMVDSPISSNETREFIKDKGLNILFIALTHAHFDHIEGLSEQTAQFYLHEQDKPFLKDPQLNGSAFFLSSVVIDREPCCYNDKNELFFDKDVIEVIHTPGHTPGSVSLKIGKWLFSGDTLFLDSVGRTDIPLASESLLISSIKGKLLSLGDDVIVYPGHGPATTIGREAQSNPFLQ